MIVSKLASSPWHEVFQSDFSERRASFESREDFTVRVRMLDVYLVVIDLINVEIILKVHCVSKSFVKSSRPVATFC